MKQVAVKGLMFDASVAPLVPHMDSVNNYREALLRLQDVWDQLTLLGQMSGIASDITATAVEFKSLTNTLLDSLARRLAEHTAHAMRAKAQVSIDILVRNLFERTADVGFLATDTEVCDYISALDTLDEDQRVRRRAQLEQRFAAYVAKYSVYDDVVVLSTQGEVLARLDGKVRAARCADALVQRALQPQQSYVERYGELDVLDGRKALVYASAIRADARSAPLGVLLLCFRFDDEMRGIFSHLVGRGDRSVAALLDEAGGVLASSDAWQVPVGARLELEPGAGMQRVWFAGREYLATHTPATPYQGYAGPAWRGCTLVPLQHAFRESGTQESSPADALPANALNASSLFDEQLRRIPEQAQRIQRGLARSVWNGEVRGLRSQSQGADNRFAAALLGQVSATGERIRSVFEQAIGDLQRSAAISVLQEARSRASLAIDIMDRNLYERANDCRWWALDGSLRAALEQPGEAGARKASAVLGHINGLYTVYSLLLLMDAQGRVVATSRSDAQDWIGRRLDADWVRPTLALPDHQAYARSAFQATPLYDGRHTYVYTAAVRGKGSQVLGGTAIVFDGAPQFEAMLRDTLPQASVEGAALGLFVTRSGEVVATTDARFPVGQRVPFADRLPQLARGESRDLLLELDGAVYAAGVSMSRGYREYDSSPAQHDADVSCVMLMRLYETAAAVQAPGSSGFRAGVDAQAAGERCEIASFVSGGQWLGVRAGQVQAAIDAPRITAMPGGPAYAAGVLVHEKETMVVVDLQVLRGQSAAAPRSGPLILCTSQAGMRLALWVEDLGSVFSVPAAALQGLPGYLAGIDPLAQAVFKAGEGNNGAMLTVIDVDKVAALVARQGLPLPDSAEVAGLSALSDTSLGAGLHEGSMLTAALP
jgi:chemotaxis signal transduction protein